MRTRTLENTPDFLDAKSATPIFISLPGLSSRSVQVPAAVQSSDARESPTLLNRVSSTISDLRRRRSSTSHETDSSPATRFTVILRDSALVTRLLETVFRDDLGYRTLSRLASTCQALKEPALSLLWRDLHSFMPLAALFPKFTERSLRRRASTKPADWTRVLIYGPRVRTLTFKNSDTLSYVWPLVYRDNNPQACILPNLVSLTWNPSSIEDIDLWQFFIGSELRSLSLLSISDTQPLSSILLRAVVHKHISSVTIDLHAQWNAFHTITSISPRDVRWENISLGRVPQSPSFANFVEWMAALPRLRTLEWNGWRSYPAVFPADPDVLSPFAADHLSNNLDITLPAEAFRVASDVYSQDLADDNPSFFAHLTHLRLSGGTLAGIDGFLRRLTGSLHALNLTVTGDAPALPHRNIYVTIRSHFEGTLRTLDIQQLGRTVRADDIDDSTSLSLAHLDLMQLGPLPRLRRLCLDFPHLAPAFDDADVVNVATIFPRLERLQLAPVVRFPHQSRTRCRLVWVYAHRDAPEGSVVYEELEDI